MTDLAEACADIGPAMELAAALIPEPDTDTSNGTRRAP
jgi:hypothetical protein